MLESLVNCSIQQFSNPINILLSTLLAYQLYQFLPSLRFEELDDDDNNAESTKLSSQPTRFPNSPTQYNWKPDKFPDTIVWRTYTPLELKQFDGTAGDKILFAVNRVIYDVSSGRNFYGPNGPYGNFAGRDASRGLAKQTFDEAILTPLESKIDKLEDLNDEERENLREWESLFKAKYIACGKLIENSERSTKPL